MEIVGEPTTTYFAEFIGQSGDEYTWRTNGVFQVTYNITNGLAEVKRLDELQVGMYDCGAGNSPLEDKIDPNAVVHKSGVEFSSLRFYRQGQIIKTN